MTGVAHQHATARATQEQGRTQARRTSAYYDDIELGFSHLHVSCLILISSFVLEIEPQPASG
jgi:hypothetical protein